MTPLSTRPLGTFFFPLLLLFFVLSFAAAAAQEQPVDSADGPDPSTTNAVQLHLIGGTGASFVAPFSERTAFRFQVNVGLTAQSLDDTETLRMKKTDSVVFSVERDLGTSSASFFSVEFVPMALRYIPLDRSTFFFVGLGPLVGYSRETHTWTTFSSDSSNSLAPLSNSTSTDNRVSVGVQGAAGVQTFVTPFLSLLGEMQISSTHQWEKDVSQTRSVLADDWVSEVENNTNGWRHNLVLARFGIGIHF